MGLYTTLMWPFIGAMFVISIVGTLVLVAINKLFMYNGPEDEEEWEEGKPHFQIWEWIE